MSAIDTPKETVFFTCSTVDFLENKKNYITIINEALNQGLNVKSNIALEEFDHDIQNESDYSKYSNSGTYFSTMKKISQADYLIADCTVPSMTMGHIITYALNLKKPVLILSKTKSNDPQDLFIDGSEEPLLHFKIYENTTDLIKSIKSFMHDVNKNSKVRLNFVIEKNLNDKIEWLSFRNKLSKTDIIRKAVNNLEID